MKHIALKGLVAAIVIFSAIGAAVAQDATWKDCDLGARDPDRSIAACSKLLERPSSRAHSAAYHQRGLAHAAKGNLDQAILDISAGLKINPQPAYRWQDRGELYARQGKYQQAVADITEAIKKDPTPRAFRFQSRAEAYQGLGDLTRAVADLDEAIRLDPERRPFRFHARANALRDAGQYDRALADYETVLELAKLESTKAWVLVDRGRTYARMGRSEAAKNDFDSALRLDPGNEQKLRPVIEAEISALAGETSPSQLPPRTTAPPVQPPAEAVSVGQNPPSTIAPSARTAQTSAPSAQMTQSGQPQTGAFCEGIFARPDIRALGQEVALRMAEAVPRYPADQLSVRDEDYVLREFIDALVVNTSEEANAPDNKKVRPGDPAWGRLVQMKKAFAPFLIQRPKDEDTAAIRRQIRDCFPLMAEVTDTNAKRKVEIERQRVEAERLRTQELEARRAEEERQRIERAQDLKRHLAELEQLKQQVQREQLEVEKAESRRREAEERRRAAEGRRQAAEAASEERRRTAEAGQRTAEAAAAANQRAVEEEFLAVEEEGRTAEVIQRIAEEERRAFDTELAKRQSEASQPEGQQKPNRSQASASPSESSEVKPAPTAVPEPVRREGPPSDLEILRMTKNRVVIANEFGCRDEQTFERLRNLRISDKEAFQKLIAREIGSARCAVFELGDPVRVDQENTGWGFDPWTCINRPGEIGRCYWTSARILNCVLICNDEEDRVTQKALEVQRNKKR